MITKTTFKLSKLIKAAAALLCFGITSAHAQYCTANLGGSYCSGDNITNVTIVGTSLNNNSGCTVTPNGSTYSVFSPTLLSATASLTVGLTYTMSILTTINNIESFWIDYNANGLFEASEWVQPTLASVANVATTISFMVPVNAILGQTGLRVRSRGTGNPNGATDACTNFGSGETEDYTVTISAAQPCVSTPAANTVVATQTLVCPIFGTSGLTLQNSYTLGAISYTWEVSTGGALGPFSAVANATQQAYNTPTLNTTTWYRAIARCANGGLPMTTGAVQIQVAGTTTNTAPYYESFEGITQNGQLPNCSWMRSDNAQCSSRTASVSAWRQARTGTKFAEFDNSNLVYNNTRYFYSNGILLNSGVTYSASVWFNTAGYGWTNFILSYGPNQSPAGLIALAASITYPNNMTYLPLSNTFQVATTGMYYLAVQATENYGNNQLVWDDLAITVPCQFTNNAAAIAFTGSTTICAGEPVNLTASGASSYTWSTGANTNTISASPQFNTVYTVSGINPLSGCIGTNTTAIVVNQLPPVTIVSTKLRACMGEAVTMQALSANSYTWSNGPTYTSIITVTPTTANNTYTVIGANVYGCKTTVVQQIAVDPLPVITVSGNTLICPRAAANLTASGADGNYEWKSNSQYLVGNSINLTPNPNVTTTYSLSGTSSANCKGKSLVTVVVDICEGIENIKNAAANISVYPNPNNGMFTVATYNAVNKTIEVTDVTGRVILSTTTTDSTTDVNITALANGIYYVKVKSENVSNVVKIIKQ